MKKPDFMTYEQWLAANPDMAALHEEEPEPCEECDGNGTVTCNARAIYDEQLAADKQKLEEFINFHKRVSGRLPWDKRDRPCVSNLPYNNT